MPAKRPSSPEVNTPPDWPEALRSPHPQSPEKQDFVSPWERRLKEHGWPVIILCILAFCAWRASDWIAPRTEELIDTHIEFVKKMSVETTKQTEVQKDTRNAVESIDGTLKAMKPSIDMIPEIHKRVTRPSDKE